jgi:hypothetical protein
MKPNRIVAGDNQNFNSVNPKNLNIMKGMQMSEQDYQSKKAQINIEHDKQIADLKKFIQYYSTQVKSSNQISSQKDIILTKFEDDMKKA